MEIVLDKRVEKVIRSLSGLDRGRVSGYIDLFSRNGFNMTSKYLKKLENNLWELRPGNIRILFGLVESRVIFVNIFKKKTRKTPVHEIRIAKSRLKGYKI